METEKLSESFIDSIIKKDKGLDLITDLTDFSIKNVLDSQLKDFPIIKCIFGVTKFGTLEIIF